MVEFKGDNYYRDMQRLAYAEMELIEKYQHAGQCLWQLPEGTWISDEKWNKRYKKNLVLNNRLTTYDHIIKTVVHRKHING